MYPLETITPLVQGRMLCRLMYRKKFYRGNSVMKYPKELMRNGVNFIANTLFEMDCHQLRPKHNIPRTSLTDTDIGARHKTPRQPALPSKSECVDVRLTLEFSSYQHTHTLLDLVSGRCHVSAILPRRHCT